MNQTGVKSSNPNNLLWIHCFKCFDVFIKKQKPFYLLECRHILCRNCMKRCERNKVVCPVCVKPTGFMVMGNNMPKQFRVMFHPNPTQINNVDWRIIMFQDATQKHFSKGLLKMRVFIEEYRKELTSGKMCSAKLYKHYEELKEQRKKAEAKYNYLAKRRAKIYQPNVTSGYGSFDTTSDFRFF